MNNKHLLVAVVAWLSFVLLSIPQSIYGASHSGGVREKESIRQVTVVEENKVKLEGEGNFKGKSIQIVTNTGEKLSASYNPDEKMFITSSGKGITPGVSYTIKANWADIPERQARIAIPALLSARQMGGNKIELLYDRPVDAKMATMPGSYWVRKNSDRPADIATIGQDDPLTSASALTADKAVIRSLDHTGTRYLMTFKENLEPGASYTILPCFITTPDRSGYQGRNTSESAHNEFAAREFQ